MRDFRSFVRTQVAPLALPSGRERKIVEEWAAQLEEAYDALRAEGLSDEDAWNELQRQVPDWSSLGRQLLEAEPVLRRLASPGHGPLSGEAARSLQAGFGHRLTSGVIRDLRSGLRLLARDRGFSTTIVLTLAICLGANAAIFSVVDAVLLQPLPVPESERIVGMGEVYPTITPNDILSNDVPSYFDRRRWVTALEEQALFTFWFDTLTVDGGPVEVRGMRATPSLFRVLRVSPLLGRTFTDAEGEIGAEHKVILSHGLWQQLYAGNPAAIGQTLRLGWTGQQYTIVGVMPREFAFLDQGYDGHAAGSSRGVQFWIPLALTPEQTSDSARTRYGFFHIGRLRPGATVAQVRDQLLALHAVNVKRFPQFRLADLHVYPSVMPLQEALTGPYRRTLYLLWAGAGFVLLIGAINIANLALAKASMRARELAMRLALGAGRIEVTRQLFVEALVPATIGGAAGLTVAAIILRVLELRGLENLPNAADIRLDATAVGFVALLSASLGLIVGLVPATASGLLTINQVLAGGSRTTSAGPASRLFRRALVVLQVALSVVLLVSATLLFTSFRHLLGVDAGFSAAHVTTATIFPPPSRYPDSTAVVELSNRVLDRVRSIPGVEAAGITSNIPLSGFESPATVSAERGSAGTDREQVPSVVAVTPGYLEAMTTPLLRGRYFLDQDRASAMPVAIVDERLAARLWGSRDPLGQSIYRGESGPFTVTGVVREVRFESLAGSANSIGTAYFPHEQAPPMHRLRWIAVKAAGDPGAVTRAVRKVVAEVDPALPLSDVQTMTERTSKSLVSQSLAMTLAGMFAVVALVLSMLGIYGVLAHVVSRRTREFGIRMALGSTVRGVFRLVLGEGAALIALGLLLGLAGAVAAGRALEGHLFGVRPTDPLLLSAVAAGTGCVALLACIAPARRATRVDPVAVLTEP